MISFVLHHNNNVNPFPARLALKDFILSNARRFYSSMGNSLRRKGLIATSSKTYVSIFKKWRPKFPSTKLAMQTHCLFLFLSCESPWKTPHGDCKQAKIIQGAITSSFRFFGAVQIAQWPKNECVKTNILQYYNNCVIGLEKK